MESKDKLDNIINKPVIKRRNGVVDISLIDGYKEFLEKYKEYSKED